MDSNFVFTYQYLTIIYLSFFTQIDPLPEAKPRAS